MDIEEFKGRVKPAARRSRLAPYLDAINQLRADGYTLDQVREYLATNGVEITVAGISRYLARQDAKGGATPGSGPGPAVQGQPEPEPAPTQAKPGVTKVGAFEIPVPKKFTHNPTPEDDILE